MSQDIEKLYNELVEYIELHGEDQYTFSTKARIYLELGDYENAILNYTTALSYDVTNCDLLFGLASSYNNLGDFANASIYFAQCAKELEKQGDMEGYMDIVQSYEGMPVECREIFETSLYSSKKTFIVLSICGFGKKKQRYQNLAVALAKMGNRVIYISPETRIAIKEDISERQLLDIALHTSKVEEGVILFSPMYEMNRGLSCYNDLVKNLVALYQDAILLISNFHAYDAVVPFKNKNRIIFDCADDNSDFQNAYWSSKETFLKEQQLERFADDVICSAASLFLRKSIYHGIKSVHLLNNAVSAEEMQFHKQLPEPDDLKGIKGPRITYVGFVYKRFDRDLFYQLARNNPDKSFIVIGGILENYLEKKYDNIYILGSKAHSELAAYYQNSHICIIPYFDNALMSMSCDPVKIHEHIAAGRPTISTYMPDTAIDRPMVYHANTVEGFQRCIDEILENKPTIDRDALELYITRHSWISRACHLMRVVTDQLYEYEEPKQCKEKLRGDFDKIKDLHPNFGVMYGIAESEFNPDIAVKYINKALNEMRTPFNIRAERELRDYLTQQREKNISNIAHMDCTGCTACKNVCPKEAIFIKKDVLGFCYPEVDDDLCVHCGKCLEVCPIHSPMMIGQRQQVCYAVTAKDKYRSKASSGGVFPAIATQCIKAGYYIAGAVLDEDFTVRHIISNSMTDVRKMYESKYTESQLGNVYSLTKEKLDEGNKVLFSGTPCQIAGLHSYLGKNYTNLLTVSVVCHGVPSPRALAEHVSSLSSGKKIQKLSFRDKEKLGWATGVCLEFSDGSEYVASGLKDSFIEGFLEDVYLRESCYNCKFKSDVYSDIILGDFWGIERICQSFDNKGVSYVTLNNEKANAFFQECKERFDTMLPQKSMHAQVLNPSIVSSASKPTFRESFIKNCHKMDVKKAYNETFSAQKFDVVLALWFSNNYGNAVTNYALYKALENMGKRVLVIDSLGVYPKLQFAEFAKEEFNLSSDFFPRRTTKYILGCSRNFVVGSDQVWNLEFSQVLRDNGYFQLSFVPKEKNKVSYGSSFGQTDRACEPAKIPYYKSLYQRFNHISTREKFGVKVLKNVFDVAGEYVLDPVFLLKDHEYEGLIKAELVPKEKYILTYILTPSEEKIRYIKQLRDRLGPDIKIINIIDAEPMRKDSNLRYFTAEEIVKTDISPNEFITLFANAEYVVTDSYHGTCFSIIFHKAFVAFVNRESERFETFKEFSLDKHILSSVPDVVSDEQLEEIDFTHVDDIIDVMRETSFEYLAKSL